MNVESSTRVTPLTFLSVLAHFAPEKVTCDLPNWRDWKAESFLSPSHWEPARWCPGPTLPVTGGVGLANSLLMYSCPQIEHVSSTPSFFGNKDFLLSPFCCVLWIIFQLVLVLGKRVLCFGSP